MADIKMVIKGVWQCWMPSTEEEYETQCTDCPYYEDGITVEECQTALRKDAVELLKEQQEKIRQLESKNVSASGNGTAIGVLHGGMTIKKEYHQQAKEVYNIGHIDRLDL